MSSAKSKSPQVAAVDHGAPASAIRRITPSRPLAPVEIAAEPVKHPAQQVVLSFEIGDFEG